jgi:type IV secretory pathway protease TraF
VTLSAQNKSKQSIFDLRRTAMARSFLCPGAGFATLQCYGAGSFTYLCVLNCLGMIWATAESPEPTRFWGAVCLAALSVACWFAELWTTHSDRPDILVPMHAPRPWHWFGGPLLWLSAAAVTINVAQSYSLFRIGPEMSPALSRGKLLLVRRHVEAGLLDRERLVLFQPGDRSQSTVPRRWMLGRVVAVPGDMLSIDRDHYVINGVAGPTVSRTLGHPIALLIGQQPDKTEVPQDCFFVRQDSAKEGLDSAVLFWVSPRDMISTQFFELDRKNPLRPLER